mgnify:CR=1 FL=1
MLGILKGLLLDRGGDGNGGTLEATVQGRLSSTATSSILLTGGAGGGGSIVAKSTGNADIGGEQCCFQFIEKRVVDFCAGKQVAKIRIEDLARARQSVAQALSPATGGRLLLFAGEETKHAARGQ